MPSLPAALLIATRIAHADPAPDDPRRTPVVQAVQRATPAVVTIQVETVDQSPFFFFGQQRRASEGSGVVIDADGIVLTNAHVVDGASRIVVHTVSHGHHEADILALDAALDLAVLRLEGTQQLPTIPIGDSADLLLGEPAIAIGNPFGLGLTVSTGVVASTGRDVPIENGPVQTYIQTDAAINPGNSGGALIDIHGRLIGINTFIHSSAEGIGFAIPVNRAVKIAEDLLAYGSVRVPWLGADVVDVPPNRYREAIDGGLYVFRVHPTGPAASAGLREGDFVLTVDGHRTETRADLNARLAERKPDTVVSLTAVRQGRETLLDVRVRHAPDSLGRDALARVAGLAVTTDAGRVIVSRVDANGSASKAGLRPGDRIRGVDGQRVSSRADLEQVLTQIKGRHRANATFHVVRGRIRGAVDLDI